MPEGLRWLDERTIPLIDFLTERVHESGYNPDGGAATCRWRPRIGARETAEKVRKYWSSTERVARAGCLHRRCLILLARYRAYSLRLAARRYQQHPDFDRS